VDFASITKSYPSEVRPVHFLSGSVAAGKLSDKPHVRVLTARANSPHFQRDLKGVVLQNERDNSYAVL